MNHSNTTYLGVDVSKAHLDVASAHHSHRLLNTPAAIAAWIKTQPAQAHLILEATGGYQRALVHAAHHRGLALSVLNPARVRSFAKARGRLAKTDAIDAATLRDFGSALRPAADPRPDSTLERLAELVNARDKLVALRVNLSNSLEHAQDSLVRSTFKSQITLLSKRIQKLDAAILASSSASPALCARYSKLIEHFGIGPQIAATLLAHLPQLGRANRQQLASLAGLAPFNRDSGKSSAPRFTSGGRPKVRRSLYLAALSAIRNDSPLRSFYLRLRSNGKPAKLALIASARKLLAHLNSSLNNIPA